MQITSFNPIVEPKFSKVATSALQKNQNQQRPIQEDTFQIRFGNQDNSAPEADAPSKPTAPVNQGKPISSLSRGVNESLQALFDKAALMAAKDSLTQMNLSHLVMGLALSGDDIFTQDIRTMLNKQQRNKLSGELLIAAKGAQPTNLPKAEGAVEPLMVALSDDLHKLMEAYYKTQPEFSLLTFIDFLRNEIASDDGVIYKQNQFPEYYQFIGLAAGRFVEDADKLANSLSQIEDNSIPLRERLRMKNRAGFQARIDDLQSKGLLSPQQIEDLEALMAGVSGGGGSPFGGQDDILNGGRAKDKLDWFLYKFAWSRSNSTISPERAQKKLDADHAYMEEPKKAIVDYVQRLAFLRDRGVEPKKGKILCLVGPPGVGKTSIAHSVAAAMNRKIARIELGKMTRPEELAGFAETYVGAQPGQIFQAMTRAGSVNPVVILDEIDKMPSMSNGGGAGQGGADPTSVLLAALDPEQNKNFQDQFLAGLSIDLSKVMFIATANYEEQIPPALRDRMEVIRLDGYDMTEKQTIAKKHLVPKIKRDLAFTDKEFQVTDDAVAAIIKDYTRESGVRQLERELNKVADGVITGIFKQSPVGKVTPDKVKALLGHPEIFKMRVKREDTVGYVKGLAVTGNGGSTMPFIVSTRVQPNGNDNAPGQIRLALLVGNFRKMIEESANQAFNWIADNKDYLGVTVPNGHNLEVSVTPERISMEKDGDSAGAAFTTAIASALTGKKIKADVAMTGTITQLGEVLAIGGVKQKLRGALDDEMKVVFLPMENFENDIPRLPDKMKRDELNIMTIDEFKERVKTNTHIVPGKMTVVGVEQVKDILEYTLIDFEPQEQLPAWEKMAKLLASQQSKAATPTPQFGQKLKLVG